MPNERISMSKLKQLIGLQIEQFERPGLGRGPWDCPSGRSRSICGRCARAGIEAAEAEKLSEAELEQRVFGAGDGRQAGDAGGAGLCLDPRGAQAPSACDAAAAVGGIRGQHGAAAYRRSAFCQIYRRWEKRLKRSMRQRHFAGEKLFVDYAGRTVPIYGYGGEEAFRAHLFISAMGASGCAYAEATRSETLPDWLGSHVRALEFYGCGARRSSCPTTPRSASRVRIAMSRICSARTRKWPAITAAW